MCLFFVEILPVLLLKQGLICKRDPDLNEIIRLNEGFNKQLGVLRECHCPFVLKP